MGKATMSPWSRCFLLPRLARFQVCCFSRRSRKKAVPLIFPRAKTSLVHMFSAMGSQYCHGKNSPEESMYTTRKMPASWMALAMGRYLPVPQAYRTSPSMPRDFHQAASSRLAYSVRMRSGSSPLLDGRGHDGPAFQADPLEGFAESPGITGKEGVVPFEGNGSAGVPFHDAVMLGD